MKNFGISRKIRYMVLYALPYSLRYNFFPILGREKFYDLRSEFSLKYFHDILKYFHDKKCIFVHIPKTAGISVNKSLFSCTIGHSTIEDYQYILGMDFKHYFKFAFVRNPWSRLFSAYCFLKQGGITKSDKLWGAENLSNYNNFKEFVTNWLNKSNINSYYHFIPQYKFLCLPHRKKLEIDFLGYFENLDADFERIKAKLSLPRYLTIGHENSLQYPDYKNIYTKKMRDIVYRVYRTDIKLFGYNFDNTNLKYHEKNLY